MKVTVKELLNVLVGRDSDEVVIIDADGIHAVPTERINLLTNQTNQTNQIVKINTNTVVPNDRRPRLYGYTWW